MKPYKKNIRVAMVQGVPKPNELEANWNTFERLCRQAKKRRADLCMSPECFLDGYAVYFRKWERPELMACGRVAAKEYLPRLAVLAKELRMMLLLGTTYTAGRKCYNSAFLVGADGRLIGRYDKTHLRTHDLKFDPGQSIPVFDTPLGPLGVMICADRRWPETARTLRCRGSQLILNPTYGMHHLKNEWWMRTKSYENESYICFAHPRVSMVTDPHGDILAKRRFGRAGLLVADLDMTNLPTEMFQIRRPDLYGPITKTYNR